MPAFLGDFVHRAWRSAAFLLRADPADEAFGLHPLQRAIERSGLDIRPPIDVVELRDSPDLVAVHGAAACQFAKDEKSC
ncbi:hypothetical protein GCM10023192_80680 [Amycolatopsis samaneae]